MVTFTSCHTQEIIELNQNKEYTAIATSLLEMLFNDPNLPAQSSKLWQLLFNKARFDAELTVAISYKKLGQQLNKSTRTIQRYISILAKSGYLIIDKNYGANGGQTINTISVRFPRCKVEMAKSSKDRNKQEYKNNTKPYREIKLNSTKEQHEKIKNDIVEATTMHEIEVAIITKEDIRPKETNEIVEVIQEKSTSSRAEVKHRFYTNSDKSVVGEGDKNVVHNNIIINNNNNNVVSFSEFLNPTSESIIENNQPKIQCEEVELSATKKQLEEIKSSITEVIAKYEEAKEDYNTELTNVYGGDAFTGGFSEKMINKNITVEDKNKIYQKMITMHKLESQKDYLTNKLECLEKTLSTMEVKSDLQNQIIRNPYFIADKPGARTVEPPTLLRLGKRLDSYGIVGAAKNKLINEILFESRFGSLVKSNITNSELPINNSINIGLKLVREKRWSTPLLIQQLNNYN